MDVNNLFNMTFHRLEKNLDLRSEKHDLIVSNIANKDTPGYKAFDIMVEEAIQKKDFGQQLELTRTHPSHHPGRKRAADNRHVYQIEKGPFTDGKRGNTVDLDKEMGKLSENSLLYNVTAHILSKKISVLKTAISEGKK